MSDGEETEDEDDNMANAKSALCKVGESPSSGGPLLDEEPYKVHLRVYAILVYDRTLATFELSICSLTKLYHALAPYKTGVDWSSVLDFSMGISNSCALRLANSVISPEKLVDYREQCDHIIQDSIRIVLKEAGAFAPSEGLAKIEFQCLGYDFLVDEDTGKIVLLEVNTNPGMCPPKQSVMRKQGMDEEVFKCLDAYWKTNFLQMYIADLVTLTLDPQLHIAPDQADKVQASVWATVATFDDPDGERMQRNRDVKYSPAMTQLWTEPKAGEPQHARKIARR
jgi:hypothetical protein